MIGSISAVLSCLKKISREERKLLSRIVDGNRSLVDDSQLLFN